MARLSFIVEENSVDVGKNPGRKGAGGRAKENFSRCCACESFGRIPVLGSHEANGLGSDKYPGHE